MMPVWIALLRGVNVGGNKKLPMAEFRDMLSGLGFSGVATYIQSGNALFSADKNAPELSEQIEAAISARFGFHSDAFVLTAQKLDTAIAANPYPAAYEDPKSLHLVFLENGKQKLDEPAMRAFLLPGQDFSLIDDVFYLYAPDGFSKCPLAEKLGRFLDGSMTARNLRSAVKIQELAGTAAH